MQKQKQKQKQNTMSNLKLFYNADDINMLQEAIVHRNLMQC